MPYIRMKRIFLHGFLWLYLLLEFGYMALSLEPGFLDFDNLPDTNFSCVGKVIGGYYADLETNCQMFHVCTVGQLEEPMDIRFLCLNGTVFDQETRVCERIDEVDCSKSERFYGLNLELYGNTQPPILEGSPETEQPLIIKSTTPATSTTTPKPKATNTPFHPSAKPSTVTTTHHFSLGNSPDIRFDPEEINISLHPGAPPDIRTKQSYSDGNKKVVVTTHSANSDSKKVSVTTHPGVFDDLKVPSTQKPFGSLGLGGKNFQHPATPSDINFEFTFRHTEPNLDDFHTDLPPGFFHDFHSDQDFAGHHHTPQNQHFKSSTFHNDFSPTTKGVGHFQPKIHTTDRNYYLQQSLKPPAPNQPHHYTSHQTEKPQRVQLPIPTFPPLTFSSPAPFSLQHHVDTKRYTKDHPRIVVSASASVSDASGRRLNYSLGTIGAAEFLEQPPQSYDEYKDEDVGLDPFYHDVPKLERSRTKRQLKHTDIIRSEEEAVNVLKFLFDWYKNNEKTATSSTTMPTVVTTQPVSQTTVKNVEEEVEIDAEESIASVSKETDENSFKNSELFSKNSKFNIIGNVSEVATDKPKTMTEVPSKKEDFVDELFKHSEDYINDNFEPIAYDQKYPKQEKSKETESKEVKKNQSLPKDYVDDNIEPIYFRDREGTDKKSENDKNKVATHLSSNELKPTPESKETLVVNVKSNSEQKIDEKIKESQIGDTETNNIKQLNGEKEKGSVPTQKIETTTNPVNFSEPKSEILESVTTEKITIPMRIRGGQRRGRKRYYTTTEKDKEPENKNVVLEKITERAHTAKDDFNYLRTLYKVYTTTPTFNVSETKRVEVEMKTHKVVDEDFDLKEGSPSDKVIQTFEGVTEPREEKTTAQPHDVIPIVTTEATTTTELVSSSTTSNNAVSTATTPLLIPISELTVPSSTSTTESVPQTTASVPTTSVATDETLIPSSTTTIERTVPISTVSTIETTVSPRRDSRRRGRARHGDILNQSRPDHRNHRRRKPADTTIENNNLTTRTEAVITKENVTKNDASLKDTVIEENSSNINRNVVPFPVTTEYTPTIPTTGITEQTEFFTLLTLNYKKIFEDISHTPGFKPAQVLDVSTLSVTEAYGDIISSTEIPLGRHTEIKNEEKPTEATVKETDTEVTSLPISTTSVKTTQEETSTKEPHNGETSIPTSTTHTTSTLKTTTVDAIIPSTISSEIHTSPSQLKSESQVLHTQYESKETTTVKSTDLLNTEVIQPETIPTTLAPSTEKPVTTTKQAVDEIKDRMDTLSTDGASTTESIHETSVVTENTVEQVQSVTEHSSHDKKGDDIKQEITTGHPLQVETDQTENNVKKGHDIKQEVTTGQSLQGETDQTTLISIKDYTSLLPKITEIFNFLDISKDKENFDSVPTTLVTTEKSTHDIVQSTQSVAVQNTDVTTETSSENTKTEASNTDKKPEHIITESYPTVYVLRTTENSEKKQQEKSQEVVVTEKEQNIDQTETYPSTILMLRTTETPAQIEEKLSSIHLSNENLKKLIEEIEESTKSVVAATSIPPTVTNHENTLTTTEKNEQQHLEQTKTVFETIQKRDDLEELTSLFQSSTTSDNLLTTPQDILATPAEEITESTKITSTSEASNTHSEQSPTTVNSIIATDPELMSTSQIERLSATDKSLTADATTTAASRRSRARGTRPSRGRTVEARRHRFSTESFTRHPEGRKQTIEEEIIDELAKNQATTESYRRRLRVRPNGRGVKESTDAPLQKSASPTQSERVRESLPTTPLSKDGKRHFIFNCFGKEVDKFYPDLRDCRLFHYCTQGYNKNQLIDMKFVCDLNTYFDDVKLICAKQKPRRCL